MKPQQLEPMQLVPAQEEAIPAEHNSSELLRSGRPTITESTPAYPRDTQMKRLAAAFFALAISATVTRAECGSGTVIVVCTTKQKVIIAADSRINLGDGRYHDNGCKIRAFNNKLIFAAAGLYEVIDAGRVLWNFYEEAEAATQVARSAPLERSTFVADLAAEKWGNAVAKRFYRLGRPLLNLVRESGNEFPAQALFAAIDPRGEPSTVICRVSARDRGILAPEITVQIQTLVNEDRAVFSSIGPPNAFQEFHRDRTTARAKKEVQWFENQIARRPNEDTDGLWAIRLVELTIAHSGKKEVGGPVDAVQLTRDGTIRWIQRKNNCPKN